MSWSMDAMSVLPTEKQEELQDDWRGAEQLCEALSDYVIELKESLEAMVKMVDEDLISNCESDYAEQVFTTAQKLVTN